MRIDWLRTSTLVCRAAAMLIAIAVSVQPMISCMGYVRQQGNVEEFVERDSPKRVRITTISGDTLVLWYPRIVADSLTGLTVERATRVRENETAVSLSTIESFEKEIAYGGRSAILAGGVVGTFLVIFFLGRGGA